MGWGALDEEVGLPFVRDVKVELLGSLEGGEGEVVCGETAGSMYGFRTVNSGANVEWRA